MTNEEKYAKAFIDTFGVSADSLPALKYQDIEEWDSVGHMTLIGALEETFDIMFETDDIIDLSSYEHGKEILKKYEIAVG